MYAPQEDSELMAKFLFKIIKKEKPKNFLDMGCGSGVQSKTAIKAGIPKENILAIDINDDSVKETKKLGVKARKSDLFEKVKEKFDLIAFNPPYLPESKYDKGADTTGGKYGWEIIERFLKHAKDRLSQNGKILLLFSSLTNKNKVINLIKENGYSFKEISRQKLFMEELFLYLLQ